MSIPHCVHFLTLSDTEEINQCGRYDHYLMYASLLRQVISLVFSFSVFIYGTQMFLPFPQALVVSLLVSATLFTIDQAIIGAEWNLKIDLFSRPWANDLAHIVCLPLRLMPRIAFSVSIAYFIATLAEVSLQHKAIDEVLQKETRTLNADYFKRVDEKQLSINQALQAQQQRMNDLLARIKEKRALLAGFNGGMSATDEEGVAERVKQAVSDLKNKRHLLDLNSHERSKLNARLAEKKTLLLHWGTQKKLELTPDRGAKKGIRWNAANRKSIALGLDIGHAEAQLFKLNSYRDMYTEQVTNSLQEAEKLHVFQVSIGGDSLRALTTKMEFENAELARNKAAMLQDMESYKQSLKVDGLFFELKNGPLGRYIALNKLYDDPEYGAAAKEFSYGLKLVIILIELSPVIVMLFFSPYSFYADNMRVKKHGMQSVMKTTKLKVEIEESQKQSTFVNENKTAQRKNRFEATLDDHFNTAFNDAYYQKEVSS